MYNMRRFGVNEMGNGRLFFGKDDEKWKNAFAEVLV